MRDTVNMGNPTSSTDRNCFDSRAEKALIISGSFPPPTFNVELLRNPPGH